MLRLVSILVPTYNRESTIADAVECCLRQSYPEIEVVVWDDGSTDGTLGVLSKIKDERLRIIGTTTNQGEPSARNGLLREAKGKYCCWLDSDDMMNMYRVESQAVTLDLLEAPYLLSGMDFADRDDSRFYCPPRISWTMSHCIASSMFRRSFAVPFDTRFKVACCDMKWHLDMVRSVGTPWYLPLQLYYVIRDQGNRLSCQDKNPVVSKEYADTKELIKNERLVAAKELRWRGISYYPNIVPSQVMAESLSVPYLQIHENKLGYNAWIAADKAIT